MTFLMMINESKELGKEIRLVSQVRKLDVTQVETASLFLDCDVSTIKSILSLIEEHPEMDDEEIAEIYISQMD